MVARPVTTSHEAALGIVDVVNNIHDRVVLEDESGFIYPFNGMLCVRNRRRKIVGER